MRIELWYGREQRFGHLGNPQRWVNVLGTLTGAGVGTTLHYQLNDGEPTPLQLGPDGLRLRGPGDFNAEIPIARLRDGDNQVRLIARGAAGEMIDEEVILTYTAGRRWPLPYSVDFREVERITDVVQVVDGEWALTPQGARPRHPGYDRLLTVGDLTWRQYRVTAHATVHGFVEGPEPGLMGGFGLLFRWSGHHQDDYQPHREWRPNGAIGWYRARWEQQPARLRNLNISDAVVKDEALVETPPLTLDAGQTYVFDFEVRAPPPLTGADTPARPSSTYRYRVWPEGSPGHCLCDLTTVGREGEAPRGSILIIALYVDVTLVKLRAAPLGA